MLDTLEFEDNWKHISEVLPIALEELIEAMQEGEA